MYIDTGREQRKRDVVCASGCCVGGIRLGGGMGVGVSENQTVHLAAMLC